MGQPAVVQGDRITGTCTLHQIPSASGSQPAGPLPFSAPILVGCATKVLIGGKPAAVQGSSGVNTPPHTGLHASDPYMAPPAQEGRVVAASTTVLIEGKGAAHTGCRVSQCGNVPAAVAGTATTVMIGA